MLTILNEEPMEADLQERPFHSGRSSIPGSSNGFAWILILRWDPRRFWWSCFCVLLLSLVGFAQNINAQSCGVGVGGVVKVINTLTKGLQVRSCASTSC